MSYAPTNIPAYVAAYSGAIAGMAVSGWISDPLSADYATVTQVAGAFAQSFDTVWNSATALNNLEIAAISAIVGQEFASRGPGPLANSRFSTAANWTVAASACAALVLQSDAYFAGQGINPGTGGGGGVTSFKTRTGAVVPVSGDYTSTLVTNLSTVAGATVTAALNTLGGTVGLVKGASFDPTPGDLLSKLHSLTTQVSLPTKGVTIGYDFAGFVFIGVDSGITNVSTVAGATVTAALNTLKAASGVASFNTRTGAVVPVSGDYTSTTVTNLSDLPGATLTAALNSLDSSVIANVSGVAGSTVTDALNTLAAGIGVTSFKTRTGAVVPALSDYNSSMVDNGSGLPGATVTEALQAASKLARVTAADTTSNYLSSKLAAGTGIALTVLSPAGNERLQIAVSGLDSDHVTNNSSVAGATVSDALGSLLGEIQSLTSSDIANVSGIAGATVSAALVTLNGVLPQIGSIGGQYVATGAAPVGQIGLVGTLIGTCCIRISACVTVLTTSAAGAFKITATTEYPNGDTYTKDVTAATLTTAKSAVQGSILIASDGAAITTVEVVQTTPFTGVPTFKFYITAEIMVIG